MTYLLPTTPITSEAGAQKAASASAIAIFIGVVVGIASAAWTLMHPEMLQQVIANAQAQSPEAGTAAATSAQVGQYMAYGMIVVQLILGIVQWRSPNKIIAILFMVLIAFGILSTAALPMMAGAMPNMPQTPMWQIVLSLVIMIVQMVLHVTGLNGIAKLDRLQMEAAR